MSRLKALFVVFACLLVAAVLAACGGGDGGGSEDPQKVLDDTFTGDHNVESGKLEVSLELSGKGGGQSGTISGSLDGPFQSRGKNNFPAFALTANANGEGGGQSINFKGGLTSTGDAGFVNYQGTDYEIPDQIFGQFVQGFEQAQAEGQDSGTVGVAGTECLKQGGIQPKNWLSNLTNEGDVDVGGATTIQISGDLDVAKLVGDVPKIAEACGAGQVPSESIDNSQLSLITDSVKEATFSVFSGEDDNTLRKLEAQVTVEPPSGSAQGLESLTFNFSLSLGDLNEKQTISAPADTKPIDPLLQQLGVPPGALSGGLGGLEGISGLGGSAGGGESVTPPDTGGGGGSSGGSDASQKYLDCLQKAQSPTELQACSELIQ